MKAALFIVATPIGNLADITLRAIEVLRSVDYIAAEDTRHSALLLQHYGVQTPMLAYHDHSGEKQTGKLLGLLQEGKAIALISDAGTPLISDPGYPLVSEAIANGIQVIPIPGPCAVVTALCVSGLATDHFSFHGFLPAKSGARQEALRALSGRSETLVFYEAPHRIVETLGDMNNLFGGERLVTLGRELTKTYETIHQCSLAEMAHWVANDSNQQKGEIVLLIEGVKRNSGVADEMPEAAMDLLMRLTIELPPKSASKIVAEHYGLPKKLVYDAILALKK